MMWVGRETPSREIETRRPAGRQRIDPTVGYVPSSSSASQISLPSHPTRAAIPRGRAYLRTSFPSCTTICIHIDQDSTGDFGLMRLIKCSGVVGARFRACLCAKPIAPKTTTDHCTASTNMKCHALSTSKPSRDFRFQRRSEIAFGYVRIISDSFGRQRLGHCLGGS